MHRRRVAGFFFFALPPSPAELSRLLVSDGGHAVSVEAVLRQREVPAAAASPNQRRTPILDSLGSFRFWPWLDPRRKLPHARTCQSPIQILSVFANLSALEIVRFSIPTNLSGDSFWGVPNQNVGIKSMVCLTCILMDSTLCVGHTALFILFD